MKYTSKDLFEKYGTSRSRLHQMRCGYTNTKGNFIKPILIEGKDWNWDRGIIKYSISTIRKLDNYFS